MATQTAATPNCTIPACYCSCHEPRHCCGEVDGLRVAAAVPPKLMRVPEFASHIGLSEPTVRELIKSKRITIIKFGAAVYIEASEADRLVREGRRPARQAVTSQRFGHN